MKDKSKILTVINTGKKSTSSEHSVTQESVVSGGGVLPINMSNYLLKSIWEKVFEVRTTEDGLEYLFCKVNLVSQYGITTFADSTTIDLPSVYDGLPIDNQTLYWEESTDENGNVTRVLKAKGGGSSEGGGIEYALSWSGFSSGSWDGSAAKTIYIPSKVSELSNDSAFITASALSGYATESFVTGKGYITASALSGYATESFVTGKGYITASALSGYATESWVKNQGYALASALSGYLPLTGGTLTGSLYMASDTTLYVNTVRGNGTGTKYAIFGGGSTGNIAFGGYYLGLTTSINGETVAINAADVRKITVKSSGITVSQDGWSNGLMLNRTVSGGGASIAVYSNGTHLGQFGINGSSVYELGFASTGTTFTINSSGNLLTTGGITMYSDERKKTILNHVELSLREVADAPLIEHYYNSDKERTTHVGSIAQYWAGLNDWFCKMDSEGFYTMEIQNAALASAISVARELLKYETRTDKQIRKLKKRISELEEEVEQLKNK